MDNPDTLATLNTQDTGQRQTKQNTKQKTKKFSNTVFTKNKGEHMSSRRLNSPCHKYILAKILFT